LCARDRLGAGLMDEPANIADTGLSELASSSTCMATDTRILFLGCMVKLRAECRLESTVAIDSASYCFKMIALVTVTENR